jgi:hypothetical protein
MSPKTTPNAERPSVDRLAAFAGGAMVSPATLGKGITPVVVEVFCSGPGKSAVGKSESRGYSLVGGRLFLLSWASYGCPPFPYHSELDI